MNRKATITACILVCILFLINTTCSLLNKDMKLILPPYLYDGDPELSKANGLVQLYDYETVDLVVELRIVPADDDDEDNHNNDSDDLSKILKIPAYVIVTAEQLTVEFECESFDTDMGVSYYKDVTVSASAFHYNEAWDTITIHDYATPTPVARPKATPGPGL